MSTDWGVGCRTCRSVGEPIDRYFSDEWDNCRSPSGVQALVDAREQVVAAHDALGSRVSFSWSQNSVGDIAYGIAEFFKAHVGHDLAPMNEYGKFEDDP